MGIIFMLFASVCFATMSALIKAVGPGISPMELVFLRCLISIPLLFLFVRLRKKPLWVRAGHVMFFRTLFGMAAMTGSFYALTHMPLAECMFIGSSHPLILSLLAPFVIGERTPRSAWIAIFAGLTGVAVIMKPAMAWPTAAWVALGASAASAMAHLLVRRLNATDSPLVIVFNFTLLLAVLTSFPVLPTFVMPDLRQWFFLSGAALFASLGQLLMTLAYQRDRAPAVASAGYLTVIVSVIYGYVFWGEVPHPLAWAGGGLIIAGGLWLIKDRLQTTEPAASVTI